VAAGSLRLMGWCDPGRPRVRRKHSATVRAADDGCSAGARGARRRGHRGAVVIVHRGEPDNCARNTHAHHPRVHPSTLLTWTIMRMSLMSTERHSLSHRHSLHAGCPSLSLPFLSHDLPLLSRTHTQTLLLAAAAYLDHLAWLVKRASFVEGVKMCRLVRTCADLRERTKARRDADGFL
jgi:hypothetical protein